MKTFTVRDLDRSPGTVLAAVDAHGEARIRSRDGRTYLIKPEAATRPSIASLPDFAARRKRLFRQPLPKAFAREVDRALAGE